MKIDELLSEIKANTMRGSKNYYAPLEPNKSKAIRAHYLSQLTIPEHGDDATHFYNKDGVLLAVGYNRVVIGDYGAYVEFDERHMKLDSIQQRWPGTPKRKVKYLWMQPKVGCKTKVYFQQDTVRYADYVPGCYYIAPEDLRIGERNDQ